MTETFLKILNMSFAASGLILTVIVMRLILKKAPKRTICVMWALVAVRLICPYTVESNLSFVRSDRIVSNATLSEAYPGLQITTGVEPADTVVNNVISELGNDGKTVSGRRTRALFANLSFLWICGVVGMMLYAVITNIRLKIKLREAVHERGRIYYSDHVRTPFVYGVFSPRIFLPSGMNGEHAKYVIAHEETHLKRKDNLWKLLGFLILSLHWFNALVWAAYLLFCKDIEYACDETVIKDYTMSERRAYSESLLSCSIRRKMIYSYPLSFGGSDVKKRVHSVLTYKKPKRIAVFAFFFGMILLGVCFLTTAPGNIQTGYEDSSEQTPDDIEKHKDEIRVKKMLEDAYGDHVALASVLIHDDEDTRTVNVLVLNKNSLSDAEEQDRMKSDVAECIGVGNDSVYLQCVMIR